MLPVSALAQRALEAIQEAVPPGESYFDRGQTVINLMKLAPSGSALARALHLDQVWPGALRDQHRRAWSGQPQYSYLQRLGHGGLQIQYLLERIEKAAAEEHATQVEERHIAKALAGDDWNDLRDLGINGRALVDEVTQMEAARPPVPAVTVRSLRLEGLHPTIVETAGRLFADRHYGPAIFEAFKAVEVRVRRLSGLEDVGQTLMTKAFSGNPPAIRLANLQDQIGKDEQEGFRFIFMGAIRGIRNPKGHDIIEQRDSERALEYLAFASLLMHRLDDADVTPSGERMLEAPKVTAREPRHHPQRTPSGARIIVKSVTVALPIRALEPIQCKALFLNDGDMNARINVVGNVLPTEMPPLDSNEEARFANALWDREFRPAISQMGNVMPNRVLAPGESYEHYNRGPALTVEEGQRLVAGQRAIYFVGTVRYQDATGAYFTDYCRYFNIRISGEDLFLSRAHNDEHVRLKP